MTLNRYSTDVSDFTNGFDYAHGHNYLLGSWTSGWTITEINVTAVVTGNLTGEATNTATWVRSAVQEGPIAAISVVAHGATPVAPTPANFTNDQFLAIEHLTYSERSWVIIPGSAQIAIVPYARVYFKIPMQLRLSATMDFYLQTYQNSSTAPVFQLEGYGSTWAS